MLSALVWKPISSPIVNHICHGHSQAHHFKGGHDVSQYLHPSTKHPCCIYWLKTTQHVDPPRHQILHVFHPLNYHLHTCTLTLKTFHPRHTTRDANFVEECFVTNRRTFVKSNGIGTTYTRTHRWPNL
jgi:hypothetical protein